MKLKNILFIAIAILTIGLFVACNDEVVATKDNNLAYTQVLESNGAFEYNGTKYDTLQLAFKAIADGKGFSDMKTIKVLRDVTGPGASISADKAIVLDLDGHTLTFIDVEKEALTAGDSVNLIVKNGSMSLFDTSNADLAVVKADGAESLTLEGVNINTAGQYAVVAVNTGVVVKGGSVLSGDVLANGGSLSITGNSKLDGALDADDSHVSLGINDSDTSKITGEINLKGSDNGKTTFTTKQSTIVTGKVTATGQHTAGENVKDVALDIKNTIDSLTLDYSYINIPSPGHVTVVNDIGESGNYYVAEEGYSAVTLPAGSTVVVNSGQCVVVTESMVSYYGSISEALADNKYAGATIKLLYDDVQSIDDELTIAHSVDINLNGYSLSTTNGSSITLADGVTLTVFNNNGSNVTGSTFKAAVTSDSNGISNFVVGKPDDTAKIEVTGEVDVTGYFTVAKAVLDSAVSADGALTSGYGAEFKSTVSAGSVTDGVVPSDNVAEVEGSTFHRNVTASGALSFYKATFTKDENSDAPSVTSTNGGDITIINASGVAGDITTTVTPVGTGSITINNANVTAGITFTTGAVLADGNVNLTGKNLANELLTITGSVKGNSIAANVVVFDPSDSSYTIVGNTVSLDFASFYYNGGVHYKEVKATGVDPENSSALCVNATGYVSSLTTSGGGSIKVDISNRDSGLAFTVTGNVSASKIEESAVSYYCDVTLIGNSSNKLFVNGAIDGNDIVLTNATVNNNVTAHNYGEDLGSVVATSSTFDTLNSLDNKGTETTDDDTPKQISGSILNISTSTFTATVTSGTASYFYALEASGADYVEGDDAHSALEITTSTGKVDSLKSIAGSINVANGSASAALTVTGNVLAQSNANTSTYYDVRLVGNANVTGDTPVVKNVVVNGTINGNDINLTQTTVNDNVTAHDNAAVASAVADLGSVVATSSTFTPGTNANKTLTGSTISVSTSKLNNYSLNSDYYYYNLVASGSDSSGNAITITSSEGEVGSLTATKGSITVDNSAENYFKTLHVSGDICAKDSTTEPNKFFDVDVKGKLYNSSNTVYIRYAVTAKSFTADHVTFINSSTIEASTVSISDSYFSNYSRQIIATGEDYSVSSVNRSALEITTSTGSVGSLTAQAGSIKVANGSASAALTVTGNVLAKNNEATPTYYDVTLAGKSGANVVVNGTIDGNDIGLTWVTAHDSITATDVEEDIGSVFAVNSSFDTNNYSGKTIQGSVINISTSVFAATGSSASNYYAIEASGADDDGKAIEIEDSTGKVASLTATAGSINVDNADVAGSLYVVGDVIACNNATNPSSATEYYDVTLTGPNTTNKVSVGSIYANDIATSFVGVSGVVNGYDNTADTAKLTSVNSVFNGAVTVPEVEDGATEISGSTFNASVFASTSFSAKHGAHVGDIADDVVYSPVIEISNSQIKLNRLAGSATESADTVTITNPSESSVITTLKADTLSVTDENNYLTVTNAYITGISTESLIAGGIYKALSFTGNAISELVITKGIFTTTGDNNYQFLNGRTRVRGTYADTSTQGVSDSTNYSVQMVGIDRMDADFVVECAHITSADLTNVSNIVAKINQSLNSQYIYINYQPATIVAISSAPEYKFSTTGYIYTGHVTLNFGYTTTETGVAETSGYTLATALIVTGNSAPYFNFGNNYVTVTGRVFVTYEASLYSTLNQSDFVTLATNTTSAPVWIVSLPGELDGGRYKYKAASMTLSAKNLVVAKNRILIGTSTVGTNVADSTTSYSFKQYYYNPDTTNSVTVYCAKNTVYDVAHLSASSASISDPASYDKITSWGTNVVNEFYTLAGGSTTEVSGTIIWTKQQYGTTSNEWCYGYSNSTLCWHGGDCPSTGHHIILDTNGGSF